MKKLHRYKINETHLYIYIVTWCKYNIKKSILSYRNEIMWNKYDIKVGGKTIFYANWYQNGIKFIRDTYNDTCKHIYLFLRLKEMYNLSESDFLKYLSLVNSIPSIWKTRTRNENINIPETPNLFSQILNQKQINRYIYNYLKNKELEKVRRSEMKWSQMFPDITLNWKSIYTNTLTATKDIQNKIKFSNKYIQCHPCNRKTRYTSQELHHNG